MSELKEGTPEHYWTFRWKGAEGSEVVVDLWSGAVGIVHRASSSEDCTISGDRIIYLPELRARMQERFGRVAACYTYLEGRVNEAGYGA